MRPIISFNRSDSFSILSNNGRESAPAFCLAISRATFIRASGERNSCEMSWVSRACDVTSDSIRSAMTSKSRARSESSSRRRPT